MVQLEKKKVTSSDVAREVATSMVTHKYRGSIVVLSISKSVESNKEQKEMTSGFQQGNVCKH